ncbi:hypothetical protein PF010_g14287 [Phytophthora fragariae]|uniref:Uncharacterized protein n=1 Tax=Phytophthora fragariae TaxID=53985 RepID=A0A6G0KY49_9STRA|nr:hypothetical protein PF010_g14287 [Phytophthora fragariae]
MALIAEVDSTKNTDMLSRIPEETKLKNRKASLKKSKTSHWHISNFTSMIVWASPHGCTTVDKFFGSSEFHAETDKSTFAKTDLALQNEMLIFRTLDHEFVDASGTATSFGMIFASRRLLRNLYYSILDQQDDGVVGHTDGAYRIDFSTYWSV